MATTAIPAFGGKTLQSGSQGPDVALVQSWLNGIHTQWNAVHTVTVDGKFGSGTAASVKAFQTLDNIAVTGKVDSLTWNRLYSRYAGIFGEGEIFPGISMKSGMSGATVKSAQVRLKYLIPNLVADGNYGPNTKSAVQSFQICQRLTADGVLGKTTWDALYSQVSD